MPDNRIANISFDLTDYIEDDQEAMNAFEQIIEAAVEEWLEVNPDEYDLRKESTLLVKDLPKHLTTPYHQGSQSEPIFWGPVSVKVDSEDRLYVTEHSRHRIQVFEQ